VQQNKTTSLAVAHRFPVPVADDMLDKSQDALTMRYDGVRVDGENYFFVVLPLEDLAKLGLAPLGLSINDIDGDTAFFRETAAGPCLYLEMETHADRLSRLYQKSKDEEFLILDCIGDLRLMGAPLQMRAPDIAAYDENDFPEIPAHEGYMQMLQLLVEHDKARIQYEDPSLSSGF
jgi:hypothetical protein